MTVAMGHLPDIGTSGLGEKHIKFEMGLVQES